MIELKKIYTRKENDTVYFCANVTVNKIEHELWYSTSSENEKYISTSNADAFILFIFIFSIQENLEFTSTVPVSKRLKFGLLEILLPAFKRMGYKSAIENFSFEQEDQMIYPDAQAIGTAMSFGVDSFFTYNKGISSIQELNYLTLFNAGAFGQYGGDKAKDLFNNMKSKVSDFATQNDMNFIWVDTNLNEIFKMSFVMTHTFRNFACVLVFQKLFKAYYYASGIDVINFKLNKFDPAYYDILNSKAIASNSLEFYISGLFENRIEKTKSISKTQITYENLNVCLITPDNKGIDENNPIKNCSKCFKCARTMVSLDILGSLNKYQSVFDLNIYKKNKNKYLGELFYKKYRSNDILSKEIFNEAKNQNYNIPLSVYFYAFFRIFQPIIRIIKNG